MSTTPLLPAVARVSARLVAFGRGYKDEPARLAKLVRDFPHLDVEEEVADALDWLGFPENKRRNLTIKYLRNWCAKSEARRVAPPTNGTTNGVYHQPISRQGRNPGPRDLPLFEGPVQRIEPAEMARFVAERRREPLDVKLARARGRAR